MNKRKRASPVRPAHVNLHGQPVDLRATACADKGTRHALVIESKKDSHEQAWRDRLQTLYANDPSTAGAGPCVVPWFGVRSRRIPAEHRSRLQVCVLHLSWPAGSRARPQSDTEGLP